MTKKEERIRTPKVHGSVFITGGVHIYGDVEIGEGSSVWFNAVIRGDGGKISIGRNTNIQDNAVIHSNMNVDVEIGDEVTIGHGAIIRGCRIGNNVMVGMNSTVMAHAEIGDYSIVGANTLVPYRKKFPPRSLIMGSPARLIRELGDDDIRANDMAADIYKKRVKQYTEGVIRGHKKDFKSDGHLAEQ
ncbi:MAG: gamma carbonic anhydrase family protein [Deltaproteobacteria bacterium]|nr:gamma carbonic anhydrase family protein [Deltaproteobacteria bacterium]